MSFGIVMFILAVVFLVVGFLFFVNLAFGENSGSGEEFARSGMYFGIFILFIGLYFLVLGVLMVLGFRQMKSEETCRRGAIKALVAGILGGNILWIIGEVTGLADSKREK